MVKETAVGLTFFLLIVVATSAWAKRSFTGSIKKVIDGDSLLIDTGKKKIEVRLYGIDCPEYDQSFSREARNFVKKNFSGRKITIRPQYYDSYRRLVAVVVRGDRVLNSALVQAGLAWVYPRYCRKAVCLSWKKMQKKAQRQKNGIWNVSKPIPPWKWKRMRHGD